MTGAILGKLFRTVFYFLTIRRSARHSAETLQLGYLVLHAARLPASRVPAAGNGPEGWARTVRGAVAAALAEVDTGPVHRTLTRDFRRSLSLLVQAASLFRRFLPRRRRKASESLPGGDVFREEEKLLGSFVDRLAADLWGNRAYFAELETALEKNLPHAGGGSGGVSA